SGIALCCASIFDLTTPWIYAEFVHTPKQLYIGAVFILLSSLLKAIVFPIAHHLGTLNNNSRVGFAVSKVYVSNIFGSTIGPLVAGFILLGLYSTQQCYLIFSAL